MANLYLWILIWDRQASFQRCKIFKTRDKKAITQILMIIGKILNIGIIRNIKHSNFKNLSKIALNIYLLKLAKYKGSFFVTRAIELDKENTDERLNSVNFFEKDYYNFLRKMEYFDKLANYIS